MSLERYGTVLFGVGLLGFGLGSIFPTGGCTQRACPNADPAFVPIGFDWSSLALLYFDGCNECWSSVLGVSFLLLALGIAIGGAGVVRELASGSD